MKRVLEWEYERILRGRGFDYGDPEPVTATGRAHCRYCGERIAKGEPALRVPYDFAGDGSWTAVVIHVHAIDCRNTAAR